MTGWPRRRPGKGPCRNVAPRALGRRSPRLGGQDPRDSRRGWAGGAAGGHFPAPGWSSSRFGALFGFLPRVDGWSAFTSSALRLSHPSRALASAPDLSRSHGDPWRGAYRASSLLGWCERDTITSFFGTGDLSCCAIWPSLRERAAVRWARSSGPPVRSEAASGCPCAPEAVGVTPFRAPKSSLPPEWMTASPSPHVFARPPAQAGNRITKASAKMPHNT